MASSTFHPTTKQGHKAGESLERAKDATVGAVDKAKEAGASAFDKAKDAGSEAMDKVKDAGSDAFGKVKEAGAQALDRAREAAGSVGSMATETATNVGHRAEDLTAAAGHELREFGENMGKRAPHDGLTGRASQAVAETIKSSGEYIEHAKLSGMARDVEQVIKNHPIPALLVCLGVGYCVGRAMKD